ncbi:MAG: hypothetical protein KDA42_15140 [Planctomycetales bacterium]|nr:hypothetical protein [Planctomycetales bacterium]
MSDDREHDPSAAADDDDEYELLIDEPSPPAAPASEPPPAPIPLAGETAGDDDEYELELEAPTAHSTAAPFDPHAAQSDHYMRMAAERMRQDELNEPPEPPEKPMTEGVFNFPWQFPALGYLLIVALVLSLAMLALAMCVYFLNIMFVLGRVVALPTGVLCGAAASYTSACYLAILEGTSAGNDKIEGWPEGDWREWFWTLPWTLSPAVAGGILGGLLSYVIPIQPWVLCAAMIFVLYPVWQLSTLANASVAQPFSADVLRTFKTHRLAWQFFYLMQFGMSLCAGVTLWIAFAINTFLGALLMGPIAAAYLFIYARLIGRLALMLAQVDDES